MADPDPIFSNPFQNFYAGDYSAIKSEPLSFQPAPTTEKYDIGMWDLFGLGSSSQVLGRPQAQNTAQYGKTQSNYIQDAYNSVQELMKGGQAIPRSLAEPEPGSGKASGMDLTRYNRVERDIRGNIIGLSGRMQFDPISGAPTGKITPDWQAKEGGLGNPLTPGLDAFKAMQDPASIAKAQANQQQYASAISRATGYQPQKQAVASKSPQVTPKPADASIPKKKPEQATA